MNRDTAEQQKRKAKEMLGISDDRAEEIFEEQPDRKQQKKKEIEGEKQETPVEKEETGTGIDYQEVVSGTISEAKDRLEDAENVDYSKVLEAEKRGKDRKTFKKWLERRVD